jgi:hypothetical protein
MRSLPSFKVLALAGILAVLVAVSAGAVLASSQPTDISGPCDEAEHASDPECTGVIVPTGDVTPTPNYDDRRFDDDGVGDISGPCDEAEHANDPECTGTAVGDDNSGPGPGDEGRDDDNSGPGDGDDDGDDDNSGPGDGDDDNSGPGDGDDD